MCYEQFSYEELPSASDCASDAVISFLSKSINPQYANISKDDIYRIVKKKIEIDQPKYSLAGWYAGGCEGYLESSLEFIKNIKIKWNKKKNFLRACGIMIMIYKEIKEKKCATEGEFGAKMSNYKNPLLR